MPGMIWIKSEGEIRPQSKYLSDYITLPSDKLYKTDAIQIINEFLRRFKASGIICINEKIACWLNDNRQLIPSKVAIWLSPNDVIKNVLSKQKQIEIAEKVGFSLLPTYLINRDQNILNSILPKHFPLCLRPSEGGTIKPAFKVHLVYSSRELKKFIASLHNIEKPIIAQPFMNLPNLVVHGARTISGNTIGLQAFLVERKFEGVTLTIRPTDLERNLGDKCIEFTNRFNLTGNYHFEFLIDQNGGSTYFIELNGRLGGTTAKVYACGYNEPFFALQAYGITKNKLGKIRNVTVSNKQALLKYLYYASTNKLTPLDFPVEPKTARVFKTLLGLFCQRDDVLSLDDIEGSMAFYFGNLKAKL